MPSRRVVVTGLAASAAAAVAGCAPPPAQRAASRPEGPLGDFRLGHNIVTADTAAVGPLSRTASAEEWVEVLTAAIAEELGGYEGSGLYHVGVSVDGYTLAVPGIPVVASPKSILVVGATVWNDATGERLNPEPHVIIAFESLGAGTVVGSGYARSARAQMEDLAANAARKLHLWLRSHPEWFGAPPADAGETDEGDPAPDA